MGNLLLNPAQHAAGQNDYLYAPNTYFMATVTCLLIDDDLDDHEFFSMALQSLTPPVALLSINDCIQAVESLRDRSCAIPQIIFIDINMPKMNGIQCLAELRKMNHLRHVPIYMYSTYADPGIVNDCQNNGASGFVKKEVSIRDLEKKLRQILSKFQVLAS